MANIDAFDAFIDLLAKAVAQRLGHSGGAGAPKAARKRRPLSPEAIERIRAAQKKRWAKFRKAKGG
jgi:hypothetical protein